MSEITGRAGHRKAADAVVEESYSFACMHCGHGWEQTFQIEHHTDAHGSPFVVWVADGRVVPSPLSRPACRNCDGHLVRIMRPGRVARAQSHLHSHPHEDGHRRHRPAVSAAAPASRSAPGEEATAREPGEHHHWHLADLLHPFHHRKAG
ncbi:MULTISPECIES: hypothetical protein [Streptomyces]|jgi:hypothetical protein|uniref:C2H2-type domain-containing protein n=1 Tax=Streptomyces thermoviolaceus subsp. thermoviolaceus TaxID=66860 RepID=A0ABX0YUG2_STRTL|nr:MULTISPECIES: hypothetical protein [Streptomyces]MCM3264703.1 hypothetical protein [Streptomyces thermoviolaceus]NJP15539.1 hypothetical protein [Streptomyces thermoviolaceus subsp. thermoviolaceus]RSS05092.1 hypothetical protein EF917_11005 [Streptomyces sp. WAC00469]WTD48846.1 hypothetical protein OG899_15810 [Streptomyces thermoviolaceus]GGV68853.1 hypothetical protein GCM10010499_16690 [Streptomyces thermoviolaceus subsp. apingens]